MIKTMALKVTVAIALLVTCWGTAGFAAAATTNKATGPQLLAKYAKVVGPALSRMGNVGNNNLNMRVVSPGTGGAAKKSFVRSGFKVAEIKTLCTYVSTKSGLAAATKTGKKVHVNLQKECVASSALAMATK